MGRKPAQSTYFLQLVSNTNIFLDGEQVVLYNIYITNGLELCYCSPEFIVRRSLFIVESELVPVSEGIFNREAHVMAKHAQILANRRNAQESASGRSGPVNCDQFSSAKQSQFAGLQPEVLSTKL